MKKLLAFLMIAACLFTAACGSKEKPKEAAKPAPAAAAPAKPAAPEPAHRQGKQYIGVSDMDVSKASLLYSDTVRNDKSGNYRKATYADTFDAVKFARSYASQYIKSDKEAHFVINFTKKTTANIKKMGNMLDIVVTTYTKKEEHDAAKIGGGPVVAHYIVYLDNGDIEKVK